MTDDSTAKIRLRMRNAGWADGLAGRPAKSKDAEYQRSWRRGRERREEQMKEAR